MSLLQPGGLLRREGTAGLVANVRPAMMLLALAKVRRANRRR
jgi:hypothetical protein